MSVLSWVRRSSASSSVSGALSTGATTLSLALEARALTGSLRGSLVFSRAMSFLKSGRRHEQLSNEAEQAVVFVRHRLPVTGLHERTEDDAQNHRSRLEAV